MATDAQRSYTFEGIARTFWLPGVMALVVAAGAVNLNLLARARFIDELVRRPGAAGLIAASVLTATLWVLLAVLVRWRRNRRELTVVQQVRRRVQRHPRPTLSTVDDVFVAAVKEPPYESSMIRRRFRLLRDGQWAAEAEVAVSSQSALDASQSEASFGPVRALVWSLPALGFLGTATEMSRAVGGLGTALASTTSYNDLRSFLVERVVPPLADAFGITLFALASTVVCFLLLSLVHTREQRVLLEADAASLEVLAALAPSGNGELPKLSGDVDALTRQLAKSTDVLAKCNRLLATLSADGGAGQIAEVLRAIDQRVERIDQEVGKDHVYVLRRQ